MNVFLILFIIIVVNSYVLFPFNITKFKNKHYFTIPVSFGIPEQKFNLSIDTSLANSWIAHKNCLKCKELISDDLYDDKKSSKSNLTNLKNYLYDEDGNINGFISYDRINLHDSIIFDKFGFVSVYELNDFNDYIYGKLGFGFRGFYNGYYNLFEMLKKNEKIKNRVFSIDFKTSENGVLYLDNFFGTETNYFCNLSNYENLNIIYRQGWVCDFSHIIITDYFPALSEGIELVSKVLFDTSYEFISVPYKYFYQFKENLFDAYFSYKCDLKRIKNNNIEEFYYICRNEDLNFKKLNLTFIIDGYGYSINIENFFNYNSLTNTYESLIHFIKNIVFDDETNYFNDDDKEEENVFIFGFPFVKNFISRFDFDNKIVGFLPKNSNIIDMKLKWNKWKENWLKTQRHLEYQRNMKKLFIIVLIISIILVLIVGIIYLRRLRKKKNLDEKKPLFKNEGNNEDVFN